MYFESYDIHGSMCLLHVN